MFLVAQLGARRHYAVPRSLYAAGMLERFFTDSTATGPLVRAMAALPDRLCPVGFKRLSGRVPAGLPRERITAFERFGWEYVWRRSRACSSCEMTEVHLWAARKFCQLVLEAGLGKAGGVYTFKCVGLEILEHAKRSGLIGIVDQTSAPSWVEDHLLAQERETNSGWEAVAQRNQSKEELTAREYAEWENADLIICGSHFVRHGIKQCGGPTERCAVVPYGVDIPPEPPALKQKGGPLRVLLCGSVCLQKGAAYALAVAQALQGIAEFRWCGGVGVLPAAARRLREHIQLRGAVPRSHIPEHYAWADVFLHPSICEGSAGVCYEAMAAGLPVITTPNAGSVVRDGVDGFIVPIRDPEAIAGKIELLARDQDLREWMSRSAQARAQEFTVKKYGERLVAVIQEASAAREGVSQQA